MTSKPSKRTSRREPTLPAAYSLVALTDPAFAAVLVREAKAAAGDRRSRR